MLILFFLIMCSGSSSPVSICIASPGMRRVLSVSFSGFCLGLCSPVCTWLVLLVMCKSYDTETGRDMERTRYGTQGSYQLGLADRSMKRQDGTRRNEQKRGIGDRWQYFLASSSFFFFTSVLSLLPTSSVLPLFPYLISFLRYLSPLPKHFPPSFSHLQ